MVRLFVIFIICFLFTACVKDPMYPEEPAIEFKSVNTTFINQFTDSIFVVFDFTDGDGDIGALEGDGTNNVFFIDNRVPDSTLYFQLPNITPRARNKAVTGEITITVANILCRFVPPSRQYDTLYYSIQIQDRAGHLSNIITTPSIIVNCQ